MANASPRVSQRRILSLFRSFTWRAPGDGTVTNDYRASATGREDLLIERLLEARATPDVYGGRDIDDAAR